MWVVRWFRASVVGSRGAPGVASSRSEAPGSPAWELVAEGASFCPGGVAGPRRPTPPTTLLLSALATPLSGTATAGYGHVTIQLHAGFLCEFLTIRLSPRVLSLAAPTVVVGPAVPPLEEGASGASGPGPVAAAAELGVLSPGGVVLDAGRIVEVWAGPPRRGAVRLPEGLLLPGLVDLQLNGAFGIDLAVAGAEEILDLAAALPSEGVTAFLPTFVSAPLPVLEDRLRLVAALRQGWRPPMARILGVHLEGPFLAPQRAGAHDPSQLVDPTPDRVEALLEAGRGVLSVVTLAPERPGGLDAVRALAGRGIVVSLGHSDATASEVHAAGAAGARMVTHLFNATSPLHQREPGLAGAALVDRRLTLGLIADLLHVHPDICRLVFAAAGERVVLTSDATAAAGMPPGEYGLGGSMTHVVGEDAPRRADGTLAGSSLLPAGALRNALALGIPPLGAYAATTLRPARLIGRSDLGVIAPGAAADLVWMDGRGRPRATWVGGEVGHGASFL